MFLYTAQKPKKSKDANQPAPDPTALDSEVKEQLEWLRYNNHPASRVAELMKKTFHTRIRLMESMQTAEILDKFPRIMDDGMVCVLLKAS